MLYFKLISRIKSIWFSVLEFLLLICLVFIVLFVLKMQVTTDCYLLLDQAFLYRSLVVRNSVIKHANNKCDDQPTTMPILLGNFIDVKIIQYQMFLYTKLVSEAKEAVR